MTKIASSHSTNNSGSGVDIYSEESRKKLARLILNLFEHWELDTAAQLNLLGLSPTSRALLSPYKRGVKALANTKDVFDRVSWLLSIHKSLRILYPYNEDLRYGWIKRKNKIFGNKIPLEIMINEGIIGIAKIARYLEFQRGL